MNHHSAFDVHKKQRAVALVITLILLSVITFLAIAFLALSRRERGSVTTTTHMIEAKFAADGALERARVEIIANIFAFTNEFAFGLAVSTNYVNANGFDPGQPLSAIGPPNVNYEHTTPTSGNRALTLPEQQQNIANLFYNPRPPVFIPNPTNRNLRDFRYYLDLNRNGRYDTNGLQPVLDNLGKPIFDANSKIVSNFFVGDPEWIGGLDRPDFPHSPLNRFTHRYAYLVVPAGKTLDANFIHNQAFGRTKVLDVVNDAFMRNEGVGTWEINLAAFLADLNTNQWNQDGGASGLYYQYNRPAGRNVGLAFLDAFSFLNHRYAGDYNNLRSVSQLYGNNGGAAFQNDVIDGYSDDLPVFTTNPLSENTPNDPVGEPWVGDNNTNHFFTTQDFFDPSKTSTVFVNHLLSAGTNVSSYDRYTFSRFVEQLGTDSAPEDRMNLNYRNIRNGVVVPGMETNFASWTPLEFFTNAAQNLFISTFGYNTNLFDFKTSPDGSLAVTAMHIPIYAGASNDSSNPSIGYTPAIHRLFQLAANLYDSTTNRLETPYPHLPSVFRPVFSPLIAVGATNKVFITGFLEETDAITLWGRPQLNLSDVVQGVTPTKNDLIKGIPLVIGAKKSFPSFNEFAAANIVRVSRILQFHKNLVSDEIDRTNQYYSVVISNRFGVEFWNSYYSNAFPRALSLYMSNEVTVLVTNQSGLLYSNYFSLVPLPTAIPFNNWPAAAANYPRDLFHLGSFFLPYGTNGTPVTLMAPTNATATGFSPPGFYPLSVLQLRVVVKNHLRAMLVDTSVSPRRIVDYVDLTGMDFDMDVIKELVGNTTFAGESSTMGTMWQTNAPANSTTPYGVINQIEVGKGHIDIGDGWINFNMTANSGRDKDYAIDAFRAFFRLTPLKYPSSAFPKRDNAQAPFNPTREIFQRTSWQANDPLVHYFVGDLTDLTRTNNIGYVSPPNDPKKQPSLNAQGASLGAINTRYKPWGGKPGRLGDSVQDVQTDHAIALKDPLVRTSDDWDFPTNKFPNVGWMGRVHRGTPWQTVFLKSTNIWNLDNGATWLKWTGDGLSQNNWDGKGNAVPDAQYTAPTNDWKIFDLFTAAPNDNAGRGQLSVNQNGLAAWSAVLSGVVVLSNSAAGVYDPLVIQPAGIYDPFNPSTLPPLVKIVDGINRVRANTVPAAGPVFPNQQFSHIGDILAAPELTVNSPFLNLNNVQNGGVPDAVYERIPQQIFGLLRKGDQRFVIYAYGQSLRPADNSVLTARFRGLCTNYQIMAEVATRAVVRMDIKRDSNGQITGANTVVESYNLLPPD